MDKVSVMVDCLCVNCKYSEISGNLVYCYYWDYEAGMSPNTVDKYDFCSNAERKSTKNA